MRDLRFEMTAALAGANLVDAAQRERVADVCADVAERYCAELGHTAAIRSGEIGELAQGEPAAGWAPTPAEETQRAW
ncbi:thioredoxin reductase [Micromonospora sp. WP24]|uniref:Thioredoxin reductase n=1 Tax=Micromonospora musae TaxID=1894970 RepID=A0A3A9XTW9_9ACTN|nr:MULTISPECIES: thioredoxin reductase [Micromonospora]RKN28212.1 thioredoxin reductase [Micromonospora musae]TYB98357.1 thioredoxin reductase [Micromonospora sp. WP24]